MISTDPDCPCKKKLCECCNGTGKVPEGKQRRPGWWLTTPMTGDIWAKTTFETCTACNGKGKVKK